MIRPLVPYAIRGVIWYQGESNAGAAQHYQTLVPAHDPRLAACVWARRRSVSIRPNRQSRRATTTTGREWLGRGAASPIAYAARTSYRYGGRHRRRGRRRTFTPATNKRSANVSRWSRAHRSTASQSHSVARYTARTLSRVGSIRLHFDHADGGLITSDGGPLKGFAIAGVDRKFSWADARIVGDTVVVSTAEVPEPAAVRYAWAGNPIGNLINSARLPAPPFCTDQWD